MAIGPYDIIEEIGSGGMGKVYKAYHRQLDRLVAIKVMLQGVRQRFLFEAKTIAKLRHPHIVSLYDIKEHMGNLYIVMDYIKGKPLNKIIQTSLLTPRSSLEIIHKLALATHFIHSENIVHRDLKPANIILEETTKEPVILDFGIAKDVANSREITQSGQILGTPHYMSPEQAKSEKISAATDVYALGVILYEMLTGKRVVEGKNPNDVIFNVMYQKPVLLCKHNPKLARDLQTICHKALEKKPEHRYPSALEFASDIKRFLKGEVISHSFSLRLWCNKKLSAYQYPLITLLFLSLGAFCIYVYQSYQHQKKTKEYLKKAKIALYRKNGEKIVRYITACDFLEKALEFGKNNKIRQQLYTLRKEVGFMALKEKNYLLSYISFKKLKSLTTPKEIQELLLLIENTKKQIQQKQVQKINNVMKKIYMKTSQEQMDTYTYVNEISRMQGKHATVELLQYLFSDNKWQRLLSIQALGRLGDTTTKVKGKDSVVWLSYLLKKIDIKENSQEAEEIVWALARLRDARAHATVDQVRWKSGYESVFWGKTIIPYVLIPMPKEKISILKQNIGNKQKSEKLTKRGLAKFFKNDIKGAIADYNQAIAITPTYALAYARRGGLYRHKGKYSAALIDLNKAINNDPQCTIAYVNRAMVYRRTKKFALALKDCNKALQVDPKHIFAYVERGLIKSRMGDTSEAIKDYGEAIKLKPKATVAYNYRGVAYDRIGELEKAIADYNTVINLNSKNLGGYINRGITLEKQGNIVGAIADYTSALRLNPRDATVYCNRAALWKDMREYNRALEDFTQAIKLNPKMAMAYNGRSGVFYKQGNIKKALANCNKAIELKPDNAEFFYNRGLMLTDHIPPQKVIPNYSKAIQLNPKYIEAYNKRGLLYASVGQYSKAIADYTAAIKIKPRFTDAYVNRGAAYFQQKNIKQALDNFTKVIQLDPGEADAYLNRALVFQAIGQQETANRDFRIYVKMRPDTPQAQKIKAYFRKN